MVSLARPRVGQKTVAKQGYRGIGLGTELVTNGGFDADTDWTKVGVGTVISAGVLTMTLVGSPRALQSITFVIPGWYRIEAEITAWDSDGGFRPLLRRTSPTGNLVPASVTSVGVHTWDVQLLDSFLPDSVWLQLAGHTTGAGMSLDNVSIKRIVNPTP